jgi:protease-4
MRKILQLLVLSALLLGGCVFIELPRIAPLAEKVLEGKGADKVALIDISGVITDRRRRGLLGIKAEASITARIKEELTLISRDKRVKAVVLRINSPGGSVTTCDIIAHELKLLKKERDIPVVAVLMGVAASGGYYIAAAADTIIAHPTTVTGSIGVVAYNINATGLMEKIGITDQTIKSGDKKDLGSPLREMTQEEREILQGVIDSLYERFLDAVEEGREGLDRAELRRIADGRIYTAAQALELKLIDKIGYMSTAIEAAKELAGIEEATVITYGPSRSYKNNIYSTAGLGTPSTLNLVNIDVSALREGFGLSFMYLWMP